MQFKSKRIQNSMLIENPIQSSLPAQLHHALVGLPKLTLEIKCPLCSVLLHSVSLSPLFPIEFCFLIAMCSGKYVLVEALEKPAQWRPINSPPSTCLSMNNSSFASVKEKLGHHGTSQHLPPPATTITRKRQYSF